MIISVSLATSHYPLSFLHPAGRVNQHHSQTNENKRKEHA
jgi:hypothetical protein